MLVLSRKLNERIIFPAIRLAIQIVGIRGNTVRLGVDAPKLLKCLREELRETLFSTYEETRTMLALLRQQIALRAKPEELEKTLSMIEQSLSPSLPKTLVIEDGPDGWAPYLKTAGSEVSTATTTDEAAKMLERTRPDLILVDLGCRDMNGGDFIRKIRSNPKFSHIKVVVISDQRRDNTLPVDDWLQKPVNPEGVLNHLRTQR